MKIGGKELKLEAVREKLQSAVVCLSQKNELVGIKKSIDAKQQDTKSVLDSAFNDYMIRIAEVKEMKKMGRMVE